MRRTIAIVYLSISLAALLPATSAGAADRISAGHKLSWGKPDVSIEQYRTDSSQCGHEAAAIDLSNTDPGKALVYASRIMDNASTGGNLIGPAQLVHPEVQWSRAATLMQQALEKCLMERGYVKFRLTDGQARKLRKFEIGSLERRRYLHSLASDPDVLRKQAVART